MSSVRQQIEAHAAGFSSAEKKVAECLLADPSRSVDLNVSETAELSGVSEATVVRFCKRLGYSGFYQMKLQLSHDIGRQQSNCLRSRDASTLQKKFLHISDRMLAISQGLDSATVKLCAEAINNCAMVHVIGCGQSRILAADLVYRLASCGIRCVGGTDFKSDLANMILAPGEDIAILISKSGETRRTLRALELAKSRGMTTIAVTAATKNPLVSQARYALSAGLSAEDDPDTNLYLAAVLDAVLTYVRSKLPEADYLESIISESRL